MEPIRPRKLADDVQEQLLALIRDGGLSPGDHLPSERELMKTLQVGRPAIREAMQRLSQMGLLDIKHGGRARVSQPSIGRMIEQMSQTVHHLLAHEPATVENLREARAVFESEMARIAARKRTVADVKRLSSIVNSQEAAKSDRARFVELDGQFHRELAAISGNPIFPAVSDAIFGWLSAFRTDLVRKEGTEELTINEHRALIEAINRRSPEAAAKALLDHLYRVNHRAPDIELTSSPLISSDSSQRRSRKASS
jgi:DNA-binding FadR family transcriptional regulator